MLELEYRRPGGGGKSSGVPVSPTCMDFQEGGDNFFILGCETGAVYSAARYQTFTRVWEHILGMEPSLGFRLSSEATRHLSPGE